MSANIWMHFDSRFISHAHFWFVLPVTVSRDDKEKPFPTLVPLASVEFAEVQSVAKGNRAIILVRHIILYNTHFECLPPGMIHSWSRGEREDTIA